MPRRVVAVETEEGVGCLGASQERLRARLPLPENYRHDCILYPPLAREPLEARAYLPNLFCLLRKVHPTRMAFLGDCLVTACSGARGHALSGIRIVPGWA